MTNSTSPPYDRFLSERWLKQSGSRPQIDPRIDHDIFRAIVRHVEYEPKHDHDPARYLRPVAGGPALSVIIPVYNERHTLGAILKVVARTLPCVKKEIIVVDDCSKDGTREWLQNNFPDGPRDGSSVDLDSDGNICLSQESESTVTVRPIYHEQNRGKGGALQTGFKAFTGEVLIIQDADLEYDPIDWVQMYDLIAVRQVADVVFGSRFYGRPHRSLYYHHYLANRLISFLFNIVFNQTLTDIEVCYKMMTAQVARSLRLTANDFGIEVELSAEIARQRKLRVYELGISYYGRTYVEGKKINWKDGLKALWYVFKFRFR